MTTTKITSTAGTAPVQIETYDSGGDGRPVVLIHGWPLSGHSWKPTKPALEAAGYRVVSIDRRGFGESDKPAGTFDDGTYDYDTMAGDVKAVVDELGLSGMVLVGFSMGGGELCRYVRAYGTDDLAGLVFASAVPPYLLKTEDNPDGGLEDAEVEEMKNNLAKDRDGFYSEFSKNFYSADGELVVSDSVVDTWRELAAPGSTEAALACIDAFARSDFREDLSKIDVPTLVIHGDADGIVPFPVSGKRTADLVDDARTHTVAGGPHGLIDSHTDEFNTAILDFLANLA